MRNVYNNTIKQISTSNNRGKTTNNKQKQQHQKQQPSNKLRKAQQIQATTSKATQVKQFK